MAERQRLTFKRRFGLDRSGPMPDQTQPGAPLNPWTIPNAIGYIRFALIPVFCYLAFTSGDGRDATAAAIYWIVCFGDYVDGFVARATGQYSRMGAILDPIVDRLTILSGAAVCWNYELLPRWALALLAVRELATLGIAQYGLRMGAAISVNWFGRIAVFPVMASIFFAMVSDSIAWKIMLVLGVALGILSTIAYARQGMRILAEKDEDAASKPSSTG